MWLPKGVNSFIWLFAVLEKTKELIESANSIFDWEKDNEWATEKTNKTTHLIKNFITNQI